MSADLEARVREWLDSGCQSCRETQGLMREVCAELARVRVECDGLRGLLLETRDYFSARNLGATAELLLAKIAELNDVATRKEKAGE